MEYVCGGWSVCEGCGVCVWGFGVCVKGVEYVWEMCEGLREGVVRVIG